MTDIKQKLEEQEIKKMAELKRREKMEEKAAKAEAAPKVEKPTNAKSDKVDELNADEITPNEYFKLRSSSQGKAQRRREEVLYKKQVAPAKSEFNP